MRSPVDGNPMITNRHGTPGWGFFGKHAGVDYGLRVGTPVYAPDAGTIRSAVTANDGTTVLEIAIGNYWHRFLHVSKFIRKSGTVKKGELIAYSGAKGPVTGPHLHWDVRKAGTAWNEAYSNYIDPLKLVNDKGEENVTQEQILSSPVLFDAGWYLKKHKDVAKEQNTAAFALSHWLKFGIKEGRQSTASFNVKEYLENYPDLQKAYGKDYRKAALHYYTFGVKEGREGLKIQPNPLEAKVSELSKALTIKDNEIAKLKAVTGDVEANLIGRALLELLTKFGYRK